MAQTTTDDRTVTDRRVRGYVAAAARHTTNHADPVVECAAEWAVTGTLVDTTHDMKGEVRTVDFEAYDDPDGPFAVLSNPGSDVPRGTLAAAQDCVSEHLEVAPNGHAGTVEYHPGREDGEVRRVTLAREEADR